MQSSMNDLLSPLSCVIPRPKKVSLISAATLPSPPEESGECLTNILSLAGKTLFTWAEWDIKLPPSTLQTGDSSNHPGLANIFSEQDFDDCEILTKSEENNKRRLNQMQLNEIRSTGMFHIESRNFPGYMHNWKINKFLQLGTKKNLALLKKNLATLLELMCIGSRDRIIGNFFSLKVAGTAAVDFLQMTFDLFIGWPHVHRKDVDNRLLEERLNFLTQDLSVKTLHRCHLEEFWIFFERLSKLPNDCVLHENVRPPQPIYLFITPSKVPIDLRLHNIALLERCLVIINQLRRTVHGSWFDVLRTSLLDSLKDSGKSTSEIKKLIRTQGLREYSTRLFEAIRQNKELKKISPTISEALIQQAQFNLAALEARAELADSWIAYKESTEKLLKLRYPLLWNVPRWRSETIKSAKLQFMREHKLDVHKSVLAKCTNLGLHQFIYFVKRDLLFLTQREQRLREELSKTTLIPDNRFAYVVPCKLIQHWKVFRRDPERPERLERIKTVVCKNNLPLKGVEEPTEQGSAFGVAHSLRSLPLNHSISKDSESNLQRASQSALHLCWSPQTKPLQFSLVKDLSFKTSTRYVFWRWMTNFAFSCVLLVKICQFFLYTVPLKSSLSLCALFRRRPIPLNAVLDNKTGNLYYTAKPYTHTLCSRLVCIWRSTRVKVRLFTRPTSPYCWNQNRLMRSIVCLVIYTFRAALPSLLLLIFLPPLCLLVSFTSLCLGLVLPLIVPVICAVVDLFGVVVWDAYKPASYPSRLFPLFQAFLWHLGLRCILQAVLALLTGLILNPLLALGVAVYGLTRWMVRSMWDALVFHLCLRHCLCVPAANSWLFKQLGGPGLSPNHFYKTNILDMCIVLASQLEQLELIEWQKQVTAIAQEPLQAYTTLAENLTWLSLFPVESGVYGQLKTQTNQWIDEINKKYQARKNGLVIHLTSFQASRTKMSATDLENLTAIGASLAQRFYRARILPRLHLLSRTPEDWWACRGLHEDDFPGLCMQLLKETFGDQLLVSLQEADTVFPLHVRDTALTSRFLELLSLRDQDVNRTNGSEMFPTAAERGSRQSAVGDEDASQIPYTSTQKTNSGESVREDIVPSQSGTLSHQTSLSPDCDGLAEEKDDSGGDWHDRPLTRRETVITVRPRTALESGSERHLNGSSTPLLRQGHSVEHLETPVYIHIDLPLFPLSLFVPPELRRISQKELQLYEEEASHGRHSTCDNDLSVRQMDTLDHFATEAAPDSSTLPTHSEGLKTILAAEKETTLYAISTLLPPWTQVRVSAVKPTRDRHKCQCIGRRGFRSWMHTFWKRSFSRDWRVGCAQRADQKVTMAFLRAIDNVGEIPHAAHIALLMHSRIREEKAVRMSHPVIQRILTQLAVFPSSRQKYPPNDDSTVPGESSQSEVPYAANLYCSRAQVVNRSICTMPFLRGGSPRHQGYRHQTWGGQSQAGEASTRSTPRGGYDECAVSPHLPQQLLVDRTSVSIGQSRARDLQGVETAAAGKWENFGIANWWEAEARSDYYTTALYSFATATDTNTSVYETEDNMTMEDLEESDSLATSYLHGNSGNVDQLAVDSMNFEFIKLDGIQSLGTNNSPSEGNVVKPTTVPAASSGTSVGRAPTHDDILQSKQLETTPCLATPVGDCPGGVHSGDRPASERGATPTANINTAASCSDWPVHNESPSCLGPSTSSARASLAISLHSVDSTALVGRGRRQTHSVSSVQLSLASELTVRVPSIPDEEALGGLQETA